MLSQLETRDVPSVVYDSGFQGATTAGSQWSARAASGVAVTPTVSTTPVGNRQFLGQFGNSTATLSLGSLPAHDAVTISFDLYVINSWDGSDVLKKWGPDGWSFAIDGQPQLSTTFSNQPLASPGAANNVQSFGGPGTPPGTYPAFAGAAEVNTLGYMFYRGSYQRLEAMDSVYRFEFTVPHTGDSVKFDFRGFGLQGLTDESWGLDNVRVTADEVPVVLGGGISGKAWFDDDANGSFESEELALPRVVVQLLEGGQVKSETITDDGGLFRFPEARSGTYSVRPIAPNGLTLPGSPDGMTLPGPITVTEDGWAAIADFAFVNANPAQTEWKQVSGPKPNVSFVETSTDSRLIDVKVLTIAPDKDRTLITSTYTLRETLTVRQGYGTVPGFDFGQVYLNGSFAVPEDYTMGFGLEKSKTKSVEIGVTVGVNGSVAVVPNVIQVGGSVETSVVVGRQDTNTQFLYREAKVTVTEADPLMKGKDVKIVVLAPRYEIIRTRHRCWTRCRSGNEESQSLFPELHPSRSCRDEGVSHPSRRDHCWAG